MSDLYVWSWDTEDEAIRQTRIADNQDAYTDPEYQATCDECNGRGFYIPWPHVTCPACDGTGKKGDDDGTE